MYIHARHSYLTPCAIVIILTIAWMNSSSAPNIEPGTAYLEVREKLKFSSLLENSELRFSQPHVVLNASRASVEGLGVSTRSAFDSNMAIDVHTKFRYNGSVALRCRHWVPGCSNVSDLIISAEQAIQPKI
jgi:hypothetical protein